MIEPDIASQARSLLSSLVISLVEDEHLAIVSIPPDEAAHAEGLRQLGSDVASIATAMMVIIRRTEADS